MRLQICPALMDWIVFLVLFAVLYAAGEGGLSGAQCAALGGFQQVSYMVASLTVGLFLNRRNARRWLIAGTVLSTGLGAAALLVPGFALRLTCLVFFGIALAVFFNAFQAFMRGEAVPGDLAKTIGRYTLAWSLGASMGFLSSGVFYRLGLPVLAGLTILVGGCILWVLATHRQRPHEEASAEEHIEEAGARARRVNPAYVVVAWTMVFTAMFVQRPIQSLFPAISARAGIGPFQAGIPLFIHMVVQALVGYGAYRLAHWRYRKTPIILIHGGAALVLALVYLFPIFPVCAAGIVLLGAYTGYAYFTSVFYASNSGRRSFNIGVNECLVGLGSFAGLFVSDRFMKITGSDDTMYAVGAAALLVSMLVQTIAASRRAAPDAAPETTRLPETAA